MTVVSLPPAFQDLSAYAQKWARPTEQARSEIRWSAGVGDFAEFYEVFMPRLEQVLSFLGVQTVEALTPEERKLYYLACAFAEAAPHHELYGGSAAVPHSFDARRFVAAHGRNEI